jgi:hypothetical protein
MSRSTLLDTFAIENARADPELVNNVRSNGAQLLAGSE